MLLRQRWVSRRWRTTVAHDDGARRWARRWSVGGSGQRWAAVGGGARRCASSYRKEDGRDDGGARQWRTTVAHDGGHDVGRWAAMRGGGRGRRAVGGCGACHADGPGARHIKNSRQTLLLPPPPPNQACWWGCRHHHRPQAPDGWSANSAGPGIARPHDAWRGVAPQIIRAWLQPSVLSTTGPQRAVTQSYQVHFEGARPTAHATCFVRPRLSFGLARRGVRQRTFSM